MIPLPLRIRGRLDGCRVPTVLEGIRVERLPEAASTIVEPLVAQPSPGSDQRRRRSHIALANRVRSSGWHANSAEDMPVRGIRMRDELAASADVVMTRRAARSSWLAFAGSGLREESHATNERTTTDGCRYPCSSLPLVPEDFGRAVQLPTVL
jgi:hypothetical protein